LIWWDSVFFLHWQLAAAHLEPEDVPPARAYSCVVLLAAASVVQNTLACEPYWLSSSARMCCKR
jgi:hypothetical protein